jgi:hypothetical protein
MTYKKQIENLKASINIYRNTFILSQSKNKDLRKEIAMMEKYMKAKNLTKCYELFKKQNQRNKK